MKPLLVFNGNCQSHHLAAIFDTSGLAEAWVNGRDFGLIPSFRGRLCRYADEIGCLSKVKAAKAAGRTVLQVSQSTPMAPLLAASYSEYVDDVVKFPYLQFAPMLQSTQPTVKSGAYARAYEVDLQMIGLCQKEAGSVIDFAGFIDVEQRSRPLFHMHVHPGPELMAMVFSALTLRLPVDQTLAAEVTSEVANGEAINMFTQHPLPPALIEELGFRWPDWYSVYAEMIVAGRNNDHTRLVERRSVFERLFNHDSQFWDAYFKMALAHGDLTAASAAFERLSQLSSGYIGIWYAMYTHGGRDMEILRRATELYAGQRQLNQFLSRIASEEGRHEEAIDLAVQYTNSASDLTDGVVPLVLALQLADRHDDARRAAATFAQETADHLRDEVFRSLQRLPNAIQLNREDLALAAGR